MKPITIIIIVIGAVFVAGGALPGTWFGRPSYYRPPSAYASWGSA